MLRRVDGDFVFAGEASLVEQKGISEGFCGFWHVFFMAFFEILCARPEREYREKDWVLAWLCYGYECITAFGVQLMDGKL